ncbi:cadherin-1-like [Paramisgurnus dabryanus]|uniref:cadherin-1-like n=1 Tax=Paramisgurnus dabryanus TaxID=90735 RepID=UPI003CCF0815
MKAGTHQTGTHLTGTHQTGTHQTGTHQTGTHQTGTHQTGTHQTGTHQTGTHQTGTHQTGTHQTGTHQTGTHQTGTHQTGTHQTGTHSTRLHELHKRSDKGHENWSISCTSLTYREKSETSLLNMVTVRIRIIFLCQVFLCGFVESACTPGFDSELFVFNVRSDHLDRETRVGEVFFNTCDGRSRSVFQSDDKRFVVRTDGSVTLKTPVTLHDGYMMFDVHAWDSSGMKHTASVRVECTAHHHEDHHMNTAVNITPQMKSFPDDLIVRFPRSSAGLKRSKRGWVIPPLKVTENNRGPFPQYLAQIKSDYDAEVTLTYSITGEGADQPPLDLFTCDRRTGKVFVTQPLDRKKKASYKVNYF